MSKSDLRPTQKELARVLGMAQSTVSMALRGDPAINEKTRAMVLEKAAALGYQPNPSGAALAHLRQASTVPAVRASLAWLSCWQDPASLQGSREIDQLWKGAAAGAAELGYRLDEFVVGPELPLPRLEKVLHARGVRGIILPPGPVPADWRKFDWDSFSVVRLGRLPDASGLTPSVVVDDQMNNALLAFRTIRGMGYKRIGFVGRPDALRSFSAGYFLGQQEVPVGDRLPLLMASAGESNRWEDSFRDWFEAESPDAILTDCPEVPQVLSRMDVRIPSDVGVAALGLFDCPVSAGIERNSLEVAYSGAQLLHSLIKKGSLGMPEIHRELVIKGRWIDGDSLPKRHLQSLGTPAEGPAPRGVLVGAGARYLQAS
ncbi:LacI family DNA-binding transcriptional regulator [Luteolibacter marinus]|uniref:LacI family DNA-binding transcriptional regulator n=1 Tax=Luteolibacter marinus TaxID=2776705 RepID=UPI001865AC8F|nr:LacI family DNA-binding transcriptional regulator [Luteolibacter marinus]